MKFKLTSDLNDGKNNAPPIEVTVSKAHWIDDLFNAIGMEIVNDYDQPFGVGFTLTIERVT